MILAAAVVSRVRPTMVRMSLRWITVFDSVGILTVITLDDSPKEQLHELYPR
jgi:hypothetical protein